MKKTEQERLEIVQDLIDRLIYLPDSEQQFFMSLLTDLFKAYPVRYEIVDGIRVYKIKK